jgi:hypothetical protein|tara:strand:+ start:1823 stop:3094 length:1272 start_codon:yes stop_codon:yes gene_type:complete
MEQKSLKEDRIRKITHLYYSRPDVQKAIFEFSQDREICPRYFEGFGKRPDFFQYKGDIFELVKKGATSFHCSEELWENPLNIKTGMNEKQLNELRTGWDLLIDIDSKYLDYSKILAEQIIKIFEFHGVKNFGIKFSGSKGFHMIIPWKSFPKKINNVKTSDMFPEWPRIILNYITEKTKPLLIKEITKLTTKNKYVLDFESAQKVIPDIILVSPRHLFRTPYSLHEKTSLASVVLFPKEISDFQPKDANPVKVKVRDFMPNSKEGEASELLIQALDWNKDHKKDIKEKKIDFKPVKLENLSDKNFPPSIQEILKGLNDGRKRALFILLNLFRSVGMDKDELEKRINEWNKKNKPSLKQGYITSQLLWSYRNKVVPPPNFDKDYYKGIGIIPTEEELRYKNPVNYIIKGTLKPKKKTRNFKNKD